MTQCDQVLVMLRAGWVCGTEFLDEHIPRYGARIHQLQSAGHLIRRRVCQRHRHESRQYEWRLHGSFQGDETWGVAS
jgi:hypothetical protein